MTVLLQETQNHDLHQAADVKAVGGAIEPDIGRDGTRMQRRVQRLGIRTLVHEAAFDCFLQKIAFRHRGRSVIWASVGLARTGAVGKCCVSSG